MHKLILYLVSFLQGLCLIEPIFLRRVFLTGEGDLSDCTCALPSCWGVGKQNQGRNPAMEVLMCSRALFTCSNWITSYSLYFMVWFPCRYFWNVELNNSWFPYHWFWYCCHFLSWLYSTQRTGGGFWGLLMGRGLKVRIWPHDEALQVLMRQWAEVA